VNICTGTPGSCVACTSDAQCSGATPLCNAVSGTCTACDALGISDPNARCATDTPSAPVCGASGRCEVCDTADHDGCGPDQLCCGATPACVNTSTAQCTACTGGACSATAANNCDDRECGCGTGGVCSGPTAICAGSPGACVACATDAECPTDAAPLCEGGVCVACDNATNSDTRCGTKAAGTVCASSGTLDGQCATCDPTDDGGCTGQQCRPSDHTCVACIDNATTPCAGNLACLGNACVACTGDADCTGHPTGGQCVTGGTCRACDPLALGQCSGTTPICSATTFSCTACTADADCIAIGLTTCDTVGGGCS
jgi:hypothetical protein